MRSYLLAFSLLVIACSWAYAADTDGDGISDDIETALGLLPNVKQEFITIARSPNAGFTAEEAQKHAPDILSLEGCHVGENRILLKITFAHPVDFMGSTFIVYADLDNNPQTGRVDPYHGGTDTMFIFHDKNLSFTFYGSHDNSNTGARIAMDGNILYVAIDAPFKQTAAGKLPVGLHLLSQKEGGKSDSTPHVVAELPFNTQSVPKLPLGRGGSQRSPQEFRYFGDKVVYEKLSDKGLREEEVRPAQPIQFGRERPSVRYYSQGRQPNRPGNVDRRRVPVELLEEAKIARQAAIISFGFPLPQGALYNLDKIRLLAGNREIPAQFVATAFWPDDSLKWILIDTALPLGAGEKREIIVEFGNQITRAATAPALSPLPRPEQLRLVLVDEQGKAFFASQQASRLVEQKGPMKEVIRQEGSFTAADGATYLRYILRLTRRAATPLVEIALTTLNDYLKTEFTDFTSLQLQFVPEGGIRQPRLFVWQSEGTLAPSPASSLMQWDENTLSTGQGKGAGVIAWQGGCAVLHDFWQRWPKGLAVQDNQLVFHLLPEQPSAEYGKDLPYWLMFPFCEGKYRLKWGMAFTEKVSLDLSGRMRPEEIWAEAQWPVVPVIPASYYAETEALGPLAPPQEKQFAVWDKWVADSFRLYMATKERQREYGFLNYGDWFGERGRNWGNNEYDLAHGLFMHFARTGDREAFRWAKIAAQHRADVDTIWFYPDPMNVGANPPHSIGHTGMWTEQLERIGWSCRYDMMYTAANGHNWCDGLMDDWMLTGNPRAMEAALAFGEHVAYAMAPTFKALGTHERSAGWSLRSIMAVYKLTYDPVYLEAAGKIASVALREQKFDQGGAWPHVLPRDHAGDEPGAVGNNLFLIGVLLGGLQAYHEATNDPAVLKSLTAAAEWTAKCYDEKAGGWPYSAKADGTPLYRPSVSLNLLIIGPLAYVGRLTNNERLLRIASEAFAAAMTASPTGNGKSLAQYLFFTNGILADLQRFYARTLPDKGLSVLDGSPESMASLLLRTATSDRHNVRAPDEKIFYVRLKEPQAVLTLIRTPHGAMTKRAEFAVFQVRDAQGRVVAEDKCSTDDKHTFTVPLSGQKQDVFKVIIMDDQRGVWTLSGDKLQIVVETVPGFRIGGVGRSRFYFLVPRGTREFSLKLLGVHTGAYGAVVLDPDEKIAALFQGHNPGAALIPGAPPAAGGPPPGNPERGELIVRPQPEQTGKIWSVLLTAAMDIGVELVNVPPYLALSPQDYFPGPTAALPGH